MCGLDSLLKQPIFENVRSHLTCCLETKSALNISSVDAAKLARQTPKMIEKIILIPSPLLLILYSP